MQLNIEKNNFYKMNTLSSVKTYKTEIKDVSIDKSIANGNIEISLYYYDKSSMECFEKIVIPFELDMEGLNIDSIKLIKTNVFVIEGNGINVEYELELEYDFIDEIVPIEIIGEDDIEIIDETNDEVEEVDEVDEEEIEHIKEETKEYYEEMLSKSLRENVKIISTETQNTHEEFLSFFDDNNSYFKLKCIHVESELEFNDISVRYGVSIEKLWAGYDRDNKKVIFKID
jgi:hypothetical protein